MHHESLGLIHNDNGIVLKQNVQRDIFRGHGKRLRRRNTENYLLPLFQFLSRTNNFPIDSGQTAVDELFDLRSGYREVLLPQKMNEADPRVC